MIDYANTGHARAKEPLKVPRRLTGEMLDVYLRIPVDIDYVMDPSFEDAAVAQKLFGPQAQEVTVPAWCCPPEVPDGRSSARIKPIKLTRQEEVLLFLRYNYARYRLRNLIDAQQRRCSHRRAVEMVMWYKRVLTCSSELVRANMALVLAMAKRANVPYLDFTELTSEGNMALLRSIDKFDVSRGFKFSTYACRAILKSFRRLAVRYGRHRHRFPVEYDGDLQKSDHDEARHRQQWEDSIQALRQILSCNLAAMSDLERQVVMFRFGLAGGANHMTLAQIGCRVGFSNERVRQILNGSLRKLRESLHRCMVTG